MAAKSTKYYVLTGLLSILPLAATYWIILSLFQFFSPKRWIRKYQ